MNIRISASSKRKPNYPFGSSLVEAPLPFLGAYIGQGPFTRAQMIELFWRAKQIEFKASIDFTMKIFDDQRTLLETRQQSLSLNVLTERNIYDKVNNLGSLGPCDENQIIKSMLPQFDYFNLYFSSKSGLPANQQALIKHGGGDVRSYGTKNYWLSKIVSDGYGSGIEASSYKMLPPPLNGGELYGFIALYGGAPFETDPNSVNVPNSTLQIGDQLINFNLSIQARASTSEGFVISSNYQNIKASLKVTEWFEYATSKGQPAWDKKTGRPINGGPAA